MSKHVWKTTDLSKYKVSFSIINPDTGEKYWRMTSLDGTVSDIVTLKSADEFRTARRKAILKRLLLLAMMAVASLGAGIMVGGMEPIFMGVIGFVVVGSLFLSILLSDAILLFQNKTIEHLFIETMQQLEASAQVDNQARQKMDTPELPSVRKVSTQKPPPRTRAVRPSDDL